MSLSDKVIGRVRRKPQGNGVDLRWLTWGEWFSFTVGPMTLLRLLAPGMDAPVLTSLAPGEAVLVGREPSPQEIDLDGLPFAREALRPLVIGQDVVSQNHALVWQDEQGIHLRDLGSTNGTRLVLPANETISPVARREVVIELALLKERLPEEPAPVSAASPEAFRAEISRTVAEWLTRAGLRAQVSVAPREESAASAQFEIPLGDGRALRVLPTLTEGQTQHEGWGGALRVVRRYTVRQVSAFREDQRCEHEDKLVLASTAMQRLHRDIVRTARKGVGGVLLGETGVGKTLLAKCFHKHSGRKGNFIYMNLARQSPDVNFFTRHLCGAVRGAAADIKEDEDGAIKLADRGTLFLDEIGELPLAVQGVLLDFLDTGEYARFGEEGRRVARRYADVLLVVGTNVLLEEAVAKRTFREDLWYRLQELEVLRVPPLRERRDDIEAHLRREQKVIRDQTRSVYDLLSPEAIDFVSRGFDWPGNFRQLVTFVRKVVMDDELEQVTLADCERILGLKRTTRPATPTVPPVSDGPLQVVGTPRSLDKLSAADWADLTVRAQRLFPVWRSVRPPSAKNDPPPDLKIFLDEVLKPLAVARMLGVEEWRELPESPPRSYSQMARDIDFADHKSVKILLGAYFRLMHACEGNRDQPREEQ